MKSRLMYVELKTDGVTGPARIGRVGFSKTGATLYYRGRTLVPLKGHALKANYFDTQTLEEFWISGPRKDGRDSLYSTTVEVDEDSREEYWRDIRQTPQAILTPSFKSPGKSERERDSQQKASRRRSMDRRWQPARFDPRQEPAGTGQSDGTAEGEGDD